MEYTAWKTFEETIRRGRNRSIKVQLVTDDDDDDDDVDDNNDGELKYILLHMYARSLIDSHVEFFHSSHFTLRMHCNVFNTFFRSIFYYFINTKIIEVE